jgi:hypothetical protein
MRSNLRPVLIAALAVAAFSVSPGTAVAQNNLIDCQLDVNAARPECQGRGKGGLVAPGTPNTITPEARTNSVGTTGSTGSRNLIDCQLDVNAARPECQGRGKGGLVAPGTPAPTPGNR